jgi:hypothetical protein
MSAVDLVKFRKKFPQYSHLSDSDLLRRIQAEFPQYGENSDLGAIQLPSRKGFWASIFETRDAKKQAEVVSTKAVAAESVLKIRRTVEAAGAGVSIETLDLLKLESHRTDQMIRLEEDKSRIRVSEKMNEALTALEAIRLENLQRYAIINQVRENLFAAYERLHELEVGQDPAKVRKLEVVAREIEFLEQDFYGRISEDPVP